MQVSMLPFHERFGLSIHAIHEQSWPIALCGRSTLLCENSFLRRSRDLKINFFCDNIKELLVVHECLTKRKVPHEPSSKVRWSKIVLESVGGCSDLKPGGNSGQDHCNVTAVSNG